MIQGRIVFSVATIVVRFIAGALLLVSGLQKITDIYLFAGQIAAYGIFPLAWLLPLAVFAVVFMLLTGVLLLAYWQYHGAWLAAILLYSSFVLMLSYALIFRPDIDCGCFSQISLGLSAQLILDLFILILLLVFSAKLKNPEKSAPAR
jgi:hypothetical protein